MLKSRAVLVSLLLAALAALISAECPNACSSHGKCGAFDSCQCYRNWMANDCSERICPFGLGHVDSPLGDLDSSGGSLYSPNGNLSPIVVGDAMYPNGAWELFPNMVDSKNNILTNTAHNHMECSNKGLCDRSSGQCTCFSGYDGSACQRASCPTSSAGFCSGHGMCYTAKEIARQDYNNSYSLWDQYSSMGCICDPGFSGADCSEMMCKFGADPLYYDDEVNVRYANFTFALYSIDKQDIAVLDKVTTSKTDSVRSSLWKGNFSVVFYDHNGKAWWTDPIDVHGTCDDIRFALERLPNNVIPSGSVRCSMDYGTEGTYVDNFKAVTATATDGFNPVPVGADGYPIALPSVYDYDSGTSYNAYTGVKFTLAFSGNPGYLKQPWLDLNLDGDRPSLVTGDAVVESADNYEIRQWVFPNGFAGEDQDYVPDLCKDITVTLVAGADAKWGKFGGVTAGSTDEIKLKKCLGDADGNPNNNNLFKKTTTQDALYNWDYGYTKGIATIDGNGVLTEVQESAVAAWTSNAIEFDLNYVVNPHLVKLVDASTFSQTRLCNTMDSKYTGNDEITNLGYCKNNDPPGFYAVVYYDGADFNVLSKAYADYVSTTKFRVFTTTGWLNLVSWTTEVFTQYFTSALAANVPLADAKVDFGSMYSNVVYTYYLKVPTSPNPTPNAGNVKQSPNVDCETYALGSSVNLIKTRDCIEKGDLVMIFDLVVASTANPKYMNLYTVMKISRENREAVRDVGGNTAISQEVLRYQIVLDMGMNARYIKTADTKSNARIFKFYPPASTIQYVDQCSMRGICDNSNGLCQCFSGYTGDNCASLNALAQ